MSKQDKVARIMQARTAVSKAMLHLMAAREDNDLITGYINKQLDILAEVRKTLGEIAEGGK